MIRKPAVAGRFYEARPEELRAEVSGFVKPGVLPAGRVAGFLSPHAGYAFSGAAAGAAFAPLKNLHFDTLVIMAAGHTMSLAKGALLAEGSFETPLGAVEIDSAFCAELLKEKKLFENLPRAHEAEHAVEVQLPFLQVIKGSAVKIVPLLFNSTDAALLEEAGRAIGRAMRGRKALFCVSSDLSHYPPGKIAEISDRSVLLALRQAMRNSSPGYFDLANALLLSKASQYLDTTACGQAAMTAGAAAALELGCNDFELGLYTHSGKVSGDDSAVVGYGAGYFTEVSPKPAGALELSPAMKSELLALARSSIGACLKTGKIPVQPLSPRPEFNQPAAIFVTLTLGGSLRGCIGSLEPRTALADMAASYAGAAAFEDPRFERVSEAELKKIKIEISVLSPLELVKGAEAVKAGVHGVYVKSGRRSGTYLPQVWEHFKKKEDFLSSLCLEKAGLSADAWKDKTVELYTYTVDAFEEQ
ncbi:MAG: AmmeMemoRadiSam system protein B [Elusimicrobiota bacterium]|nr:AmmeMemoRadiSam system protein B [Elusimicrobiota bacterium]